MNRPYLVVCPTCDPAKDGNIYTGPKKSLLQAQADQKRHEDRYDCDNVRIEANE
jgi:hypothetical protein